MSKAEELYLEARINLEAEFPEASLQLIERALALAPDTPRYYLAAADAYLLQGQPSRALAFYAAAFRQSPDDPYLFTRVLHMALLQEMTALVAEMEENISHFPAQAEFYAALANAYASAGQFGTAAHWFDRAHHLNGDIKYAIESAILHRDDPAVQVLLGRYPAELHNIAQHHWEQAHETFATPDANLTCVVTTNLTKKLVINKDKGPPKLDMIAATLASWQAALQPQNTRTIICFDQPKVMEPDAETYAAALAGYCKEQGYELVLKQGNGLKQNVLDALAVTHTGFFTLLEHDFLFHDCPLQSDIMDLMINHSFIHVVQFNRRHNLPTRWDTHLWPEPVVSTSLLRTPRFSNNPYIGRTAKIRAHFVPLFSGTNKHDGTNAGAGGLEEQVKQHIADLVQHFGFGFAQRWSGYYLYGRAMEAPRLTHTGI